MILQGLFGESKVVLTLYPWNTIQGKLEQLKGGLDTVSLEHYPGKGGTAIILTTVKTTARIDWEHIIWHILF